MADWSKIKSKGSVDDRRGSPVAFASGGLGLLGASIFVVLQLLGGQPVDVGSILNQLPTNADQSTLTGQQFKGEDDYEKFTSAVLGSTNETWSKLFQQSNRQYIPPKLVLFRSATQSGCGYASSDVGPHYCPEDGTIYIDETFYDELTKRFKAKGGDVAEAYVLAHEVGHHVQHQIGLINKNSAASNSDSVKIELQADCFAGIWAYSIKDNGVFEPREINEALDAAAAVGDDQIQASVQGQVNPETWTYGSSAKRVYWFNQGYLNGAPSACDTSQES